MFLDNKYTKCYFRIIEKAKNENRNRKDRYFESHHIIPKSCGGDNTKNNLVFLTPKEHFICHLLLTYMCESQYHYYKMVFALNMFRRGTNKRSIYTSRMYKLLKPKIAIALSNLHKGKAKPNSGGKGKPKTEEHRKKISEGQQGKKRPHKLKAYEVVSPSGQYYSVTDRKAFCDEHAIKYNEFSRAAASGKRYKGWTILPV